MTRLEEKDLELFKTIARMTQGRLLSELTKIVKNRYKKQQFITQDYILCEGDIPIMLVAHLDTVFKEIPKEIYFDQQKQVMWSPTGLGADDRAGVFAILKIINKGYRPHICFCTDEEKGGLGASTMVQDIPVAPFDIKYIVELDRQGSSDCVFYNCDNEEFENFVESYGFFSDWGTFSDISEICPIWKIAGVNLSVGYIDEHCMVERLHTNYLAATIKRVCKMLDEVDNAPSFEYRESILYRHFGKYWQYMYPDDGYPIDEWETYNAKILCTKCHTPVPIDEAIRVQMKDSLGAARYYCLDCLTKDNNIEWCAHCGEAFEKAYEEDKYCMSCKKKLMV